MLARGRLDAELVEDVLDVGLDGLDAEVEELGDAEVRAPLAHQLQDLALPGGQRVDEPGPALSSRGAGRPRRGRRPCRPPTIVRTAATSALPSVIRSLRR